MLYPKNVEETMAWASELWKHHGLYAQAIRKAVRYFMTEVELTGKDVSFSERKSYLEVLNDKFNVLGEVAAVGDDCIGWGQSFTSTYVPFTRTLSCPCGCDWGFRVASEQMGLTHDKQGFTIKCPACRKTTRPQVKDRTSEDSRKKMIVNRWPPQYVKIRMNPISRRKIFEVDIWNYDWLADGIRSGDPLYLEDTPMEYIQAIMNDQSIEFTGDGFFHMILPNPAAIECDLKGWGVPLFMNEFEDALRVIMLDRMNEAIMTDCSVPFKVLAPPTASGTGSDQGGSMDAMWGIGLNQFAGNVKDMLLRHQTNPTGYNFLPFPLEYQQLGGGAKDMVNIEMMEHEEMRLLRAMGIPTEFYTGSLNSAGPIIGLRMFEREWQFFAKALNDWISWLVRQQGQLMQWSKVKANLIPVSMYEDPNEKGVIMEMNNAGKVSDATAFRQLRLNPEYEAQRIMDEQDEKQDLLAKRQEKMQAQAENSSALKSPSVAATVQSQQAPQGGQGAPAGGPTGQAPATPGAAGAQSMSPQGATLDQMMADAESKAQELMQMDSLTKRRSMQDLKHNNETMYNQVKGFLDKMENDAKMQGLQQARQPQQ